MSDIFDAEDIKRVESLAQTLKDSKKVIQDNDLKTFKDVSGMCFDGISQLYELSAFNMMLFNSLKRTVDKLPEEAMVEFENAIEEFKKDHKFIQWWKRRTEDLKKGGGI